MPCSPFNHVYREFRASGCVHPALHTVVASYVYLIRLRSGQLRRSSQAWALGGAAWHQALFSAGLRWAVGGPAELSWLTASSGSTGEHLPVCSSCRPCKCPPALEVHRSPLCRPSPAALAARKLFFESKFCFLPLTTEQMERTGPTLPRRVNLTRSFSKNRSLIIYWTLRVRNGVSHSLPSRGSRGLPSRRKTRNTQSQLVEVTGEVPNLAVFEK